MKTILKISAAFLIIFVTFMCTDMLFGYIADKTLFNRPYSKMQYTADEKIDTDILIMGNSRANYGYDTPYMRDSLGIKAFNAGQDGRSLSYHLPLLKAYLTHNFPKLIILEIAPSLDGDFNERINMLYPLIDRYPEICATASKIDSNNKYYLRSRLYRHNSSLHSEVRDRMNPFNPSELGFTRLPITNNLKGAKESKLHLSDTDSTEKELLVEFIALCKTHHIPLIAVTSPIYYKFEVSKELTSTFKSYDIPYIDNHAYRFAGDQSQYFYDDSHLNELGARLYTKYFIQQLRQRHLLPDAH